jgi:hypothetical protein
MLRKTALAALLLALALPAAAQLPAHELPAWWTIPNPSALNNAYPEVGSCKVSGVTHIRVKFWLSVGTTQPLPSQIQDPVWGDVRLHTAWDKTWATVYGGNHVDLPDGFLELRGGAWQLTWSLDVPLDASDPFNFRAYSARLFNAWVDFALPDPGEKVFILSWECRAGAPVFSGFEREDLPPLPPGEGAACEE